MTYKYAHKTSVPVERSKLEIEKLLRKHGATSFASMWSADRYVVMFELRKRRVRFDVPAPTSKQFPKASAWDAESRRRWRVLLLLLKAKLELVGSGDVDFESEFLSYMITGANGATVAERVLPELDRILSSAPLPPMLTGGSP